MTLPDTPRWVEANGIAADPAHWREQLGDAYALGHDAANLIVIIGNAEPRALAALVARHPQHVLLLESPELAPRPAQRAILHTLPEPDAMPALEGAVALPLDAPLPHPLADELAWARRRGDTIWTTYVDGEPASFAYAPWRSPTLFDVSVDTLPAARQLGLATITAAAMIRDERARGREPVWGADEDNIASLRLAARLGFEPVDEIWVCAP